MPRTWDETPPTRTKFDGRVQQLERQLRSAQDGLRAEQGYRDRVSAECWEAKAELVHLESQAKATLTALGLDFGSTSTIQALALAGSYLPSIFGMMTEGLKDAITLFEAIQANPEFAQSEAFPVAIEQLKRALGVFDYSPTAQALRVSF